ncbi:oligosaccharide flippase family protein [Serratia sp. L9]|uniref:oligosaccharide flippase family protein n=1 Tax=Serratia sp. L9 TaxID=3423946 RepID=UPI003D675047
MTNNTSPVWQVLSSLCNAFLQLLVTIIAARILSHQDLASLSVVTLIFGLITIPMENGVQHYIIKLGEEQKNSDLRGLNFVFISFFLLINFSILLMTSLTNFISNEILLSSFFMTLPLLIGIIISIYIGRLYSQRNYKRIAAIQVTSRLFSLALLLLLLHLGFHNIYVFSINYMIFYVFQFILIVFFTRNLSFNVMTIKPDLKNIRYSFDVIISQFLIFLRGQLDIILVNIFFSKEVISSYFLAKQLVGRGFEILSTIYIKEAFPRLCACNGNVESLIINIKKGNRIYTSVQFILFSFYMFFSALIIEVILSRDVKENIYYFWSTAILFFVRSLSVINPNVSLAVGRSRDIVVWNLSSLLFYFILSITMVNYSIKSYILSMIVYNVIVMYVTSIIFIKKAIGVWFSVLKFEFIVSILAFVIYFIVGWEFYGF